VYLLYHVLSIVDILRPAVWSVPLKVLLFLVVEVLQLLVFGKYSNLVPYQIKC
jgi:flagellar biosynthesis protein FliP